MFVHVAPKNRTDTGPEDRPKTEGKGFNDRPSKVCKTFIRRFNSDPRLQENTPDTTFESTCDLIHESHRKSRNGEGHAKTRTKTGRRSGLDRTEITWRSTCHHFTLLSLGLSIRSYFRMASLGVRARVNVTHDHAQPRIVSRVNSGRSENMELAHSLSLPRSNARHASRADCRPIVGL